MSYKKGVDKSQFTLLPVCLDDYIPDDHICRVISAFVNQLDMKELGFKYAEHEDIGNRPYDPRMMLSLYIYGYLHRIRSSRRLEAETHRNIEVMWLMDELTPNNKTICNFRKDNTKSLMSVFREFNLLCKNLSLFGGKLTATDGTKFRANNSRKNNHNKITVEKTLSYIDKKITEYMNALEEADSSDSVGTNGLERSSDEIKEILKKLKERKAKFESFSSRLKTEEEISTIDPDSRLMHSGGDARPLDVCYNVQTIVDSKHCLIVDFEVSARADDKGNLDNMTKKAKEVMGVEKLTNLADKGYYDGEDIVSCESKGVTCLVAKPKSGGGNQEKGFKREQFVYDREKNCYICPCKKELSFKREEEKDKKKYYVYNNFPACQECEVRAKCTSSRYRNILRISYQDTLDIVDKRTQEKRELYNKRQAIVEHVFGTIKSVWGYKQCLCRRKPKVEAEISLSYLCYNFRRVLNIYGENIKELIGAMRIYSSFFFNFLIKLNIIRKISIFLKNKGRQLQFNHFRD